jgi:hypothetical protein
MLILKKRKKFEIAQWRESSIFIYFKIFIKKSSTNKFIYLQMNNKIIKKKKIKIYIFIQHTNFSVVKKWFYNTGIIYLKSYFWDYENNKSANKKSEYMNKYIKVNE